MSLNTIQDRPIKSLIHMYFSSTIHKSLTELKLRTKQQLLFLWEEASEYEPILSLYRRQLETYKRSTSLSTEKLIEHKEIFVKAKESLIKTIYI
jgi:hypothetical protein